jgi:ribosomal protein S18 acetylase RimI-like enzyme
MLTQIDDPQAALAGISASAAERMLLTSFQVRHADVGTRVISLVDDHASPRALLVHAGLACKVHAEAEALEPLVADVLAQRIEQQPPWPDEDLRGAWAEAGRSRLRLVHARESIWQAFVSGGFELIEDRRNFENAWLFHIEGQPRLADQVRHPCRLGRGLELHELIRRGIDYDESGERSRRSLELEPSFVCEVDDEPVCWSATHVGGVMGMIYTPPEHRRRGYARSLAAFQIDHMLARDGIACAMVLEDNTASQRLLESFGAERQAERVGWRLVGWPPPGR